MVVLEPVPAILPGLMVQLPDGNPLKTTAPKFTAQVGWVVSPTMGAFGVGKIASILNDEDGPEVQVAFSEVTV